MLEVKVSRDERYPDETGIHMRFGPAHPAEDADSRAA